MRNIDDFKDAKGEKLLSVHEFGIDWCDDPIEYTLLKFSGGKFLIIRTQSSYTTYGGVVSSSDTAELIKWLENDHGIKPHS